jgi:hypothetical protein
MFVRFRFGVATTSEAAPCLQAIRVALAITFTTSTFRKLPPPRRMWSVNADLQDEYGATRDEAVARIEAVVEKWVKGETVPTRATTALRSLL